MVDKNTTIQKASKGYIKDWYNSNRLKVASGENNGMLPNFDRNKALEAIREDYAVQTAISKLVDKTLENGYNFSAEDGKSNLNTFLETSKKIRFDRVMRNILYQLYAYQNCFIEIVKDGNSKVKELHVLETTLTEPVVNSHGEIIEYIQRVPNSNQDPVSWNPDEVTHIKLNYLTTNTWSDIEIKAIYTSVLIKQYIMRYFGWKYGTNQMRPLIGIKDASGDSVKDFLSYLKRMENDITKPIPYEGEIDTKLLIGFDGEQPLMTVLDKCDENIYSLMHVPPIASNETGNSNRSSADQQVQMMAVRIKAVQNSIKEAFENDLSIKSGFGKIIINWFPVIKTDFEKLFTTVEPMKTIGIKVVLIVRFMRDEGFYNEKSIIDKEAYTAESTGKSEDMFPSRQRKPEDETSKNIGTGENSTTREDQLVAKAKPKLTYDIREKESKFKQYPYVY